jgi:hypothetical protein
LRGFNCLIQWIWTNYYFLARDYNATLVSAAGCDSLATLHLNINPVVTGEETVAICEGQLPYTWNNQSIIVTGDYNTTLPNIVGCDSVATLHLIVNPNVTGNRLLHLRSAFLYTEWTNITAAGY